MKAETDPPTSKSSAKKGPVQGLRTGKIHTTKSSAAEILRKIGVTPADQRLADKALKIAAGGPKAKALSVSKGKNVVAAKRVQSATTKKR